MSPLHFQTDELSTEDFSEFSSLSVQLVNAAEFMIDELRSIINSEDKLVFRQNCYTSNRPLDLVLSSIILPTYFKVRC